jgi:hypothetical protein
MQRQTADSSDRELALQVSRLWPHREHEANAALGLLCRAGLHRWRQLDLAQLFPGRNISFCFWCSRVKLDGIIHDI